MVIEVRINAYLWEGGNNWEGNKASWITEDVLHLFFLVQIILSFTTFALCLQ